MTPRALLQDQLDGGYMYERYTERARQVIVLAYDEAKHLKHNYIGTEHLLLGLLAEEDGLASRVLVQMGLDLDKTRELVAKLVGTGDEEIEGEIPFTPRTKKCLELALREALSLGHNYIGTEHLLLGMVREAEGVAYRILTDREITGDSVREEIIRMLRGRPVQQHFGRSTVYNQLIVGRGPGDPFDSSPGIDVNPDGKDMRVTVRGNQHRVVLDGTFYLVLSSDVVADIVRAAS